MFRESTRLSCFEPLWNRNHSSFLIATWMAAASLELLAGKQCGAHFARILGSVASASTLMRWQLPSSDRTDSANILEGCAFQEHAHRLAQSLAHYGLARGGSSLQFAGHGLVIDLFVHFAGQRPPKRSTCCGVTIVAPCSVCAHQNGKRSLLQEGRQLLE